MTHPSVVTIGGRGEPYSAADNGFVEHTNEEHATAEALPRTRGALKQGFATIVPGWSYAKSAIRFTFDADLVHPLSFGRCYISLPELLPSQAARERFAEGVHTMESESAGGPGPTNEGMPLAVGAEVQYAGASARVPGYIVVPGTAEGSNVAGGVADDECGHEAASIFPSSNCSNAPAFELPGSSAAAGHRLFFGGIFAAGGLGLALEGMFLGETLSRRRSRRNPARRSKP